MLFKESGWESPNLKRYHEDNLKLARAYSGSVFKEFGDFVKAVVLFGSLTKDTSVRGGDVDVLVVIDDTLISLSQEVLDSFELINQRLILEVSPNLHVHAVSLTAFWDYVRNGDPVMVNILRDGVVLVDSNFVTPMQKMLFQGRIRPSHEAVYNYARMAPSSVLSANVKLLGAVVDLYWAVMDITHAFLMYHGELPPSPEHVLDLMGKYKVFSGDDKKLFSELYSSMKDIVHRKKSSVSGREFDDLRRRTVNYYNKLKKEIGL